MSTGAKQRKPAPIIPQGGTYMAGYRAMRRWVLLFSYDLLFGKVCR